MCRSSRDAHGSGSWTTKTCIVRMNQAAHPPWYTPDTVSPQHRMYKYIYHTQSSGTAGRPPLLSTGTGATTTNFMYPFCPGRSDGELSVKRETPLHLGHNLQRPTPPYPSAWLVRSRAGSGTVSIFLCRARGQRSRGRGGRKRGRPRAPFARNFPLRPRIVRSTEPALAARQRSEARQTHGRRQ